MYKTIWKNNTKNNITDKLKENIETDILIIGGGITGLSCAYHLKNKGYKITLVEQNKIGQSFSAHSSGKLTYLQDNIYSKIKNIYDNKTAYLYYQAQKEAIELVKDIIIENNIKCDFENNSSYLFAQTKKGIKKIKKEETFFIKNKIPYKKISTMPISIDCKYGIKANNTAVFNPLKYTIALKDICIKNKVNIYEKTKIDRLIKKKSAYLAYTKRNYIKAKYVIIATAYPSLIHPLFPIKTHIEKTYACAGITPKNKMFNAINTDDKLLSLRYYTENKKNYLIYISKSKKTNQNTLDLKNYQDIIWEAKTSLFEEVTNAWINHDIISNDFLPLIGKYDNNLFIATAFNNYKMTNGSISGKIISDLIQNKENKYTTIFNPTRKNNLKTALKSIEITSNSIKTLIKKLTKEKVQSHYTIMKKEQIME